MGGIDFVSGLNELVIIDWAWALKREATGRAAAVSIAMLVAEALEYGALFFATQRTRILFPRLGPEFLIRGRESGCHQ
jgi:hypothetical protein